MAGLVGPEGGFGLLGGAAGELAGELLVAGGTGALPLVGGAELVVAGPVVVVVGAAVVVGEPLVVGAAELESTTRPGAGSSSAFAIWFGPVGNEIGCEFAASWLARLALPATTAPRATATSIARAVGLWRGDPFTEGDRITTVGPPIVR